MDKELKAALENMATKTFELDAAISNEEHAGDATWLIAHLCAVTFAQSHVIGKLCMMLDTARTRPLQGMRNI